MWVGEGGYWGEGGDRGAQTPSTSLRHPSFKEEEGAGKRCSECERGCVDVSVCGRWVGGWGVRMWAWLWKERVKIVIINYFFYRL